MSQAIINAMWQKLTADQTAGSFYAAVGGRIYNVEGLQTSDTPAFPYCVFSMSIGDPLNHAYGGVVTHQPSFQFDLWGKLDDGAAALGTIENLLFQLLDMQTIAPAGFDRGACRFTNRMVQIPDDIAIHLVDELEVIGTDH